MKRKRSKFSNRRKRKRRKNQKGGGFRPHGFYSFETQFARPFKNILKKLATYTSDDATKLR